MKQMIPLLLLLAISCGSANNNSQNSELQTNITIETEIKESIVKEQTAELISEEQKFKMFCAALSNFSTAPNYVVVTVKNLNTGKVKEICTESPFLEGAYMRQTGKSYSDIYKKDTVVYVSPSIDCKKYPKRYFEFSKKNALENISYDLYSESELNNYAKNINVADIVNSVKNGSMREITFCYDNHEKCRKEQIMFAHLMFNSGIMMTRGCVAGNVCELYVYEEKTNNSK